MGWRNNLLKTNSNEIRNTENQHKTSNKSMPKRRCFTPKRCFHLNSVCLAAETKTRRQMLSPDVLGSQESGKTWWTNLPKAGIVYVVSPDFDCWAWLRSAVLGTISSAWVFSAGLGSAGSGSGLPPFPMALPALSLQCSAGLSYACHLELHSSWETGGDRPWQKRDKVCSTDHGSFPEEEMEQNSAASVVHSLFLPPKPQPSDDGGGIE